MGKSRKVKKVAKPIVTQTTVSQSSISQQQPSSSSLLQKKSGHVQLRRQTLIHLRELLQVYNNQNQNDGQLEEKQSVRLTKEKQLGEWGWVYDRLIVLGFSHELISQGLRQIRKVCLEDYLDWACLTLRSDELPAKFSIGAISSSETQTQIILTARPEAQQQTTHVETGVAEIVAKGLLLGSNGNQNMEPSTRSDEFFAEDEKCFPRN